jgi:hypothetical protein
VHGTFFELNLKCLATQQAFGYCKEKKRKCHGKNRHTIEKFDGAKKFCAKTKNFYMINFLLLLLPTKRLTCHATHYA